MVLEYSNIMKDEREPDELLRLHADLCKMLSHPTRLRIMEQLRDGEKTVSQLVSNVDASQSNISQHLGELKRRRLVRSRRDGSNVYYHLSQPKILDACDTIREVLINQLTEESDLLKTELRGG